MNNRSSGLIAHFGNVLKKHPLVSTLTGALVIGFACYYTIIANPPGYCESQHKNYSDEEFIRYALANYPSLMNPNDGRRGIGMKHSDITDFLTKYPDCCKVFRERDDEVKEKGWLFWWGHSVIVRTRNEESLIAFHRSEKVLVDKGIFYLVVDNCLNGDDPAWELIPGG